MCKKEVEFGTHLFYAVHIVSKAGVTWVIPQSPRNILFSEVFGGGTNSKNFVDFSVLVAF